MPSWWFCKVLLLFEVEPASAPTATTFNSYPPPILPRPASPFPPLSGLPCIFFARQAARRIFDSIRKTGKHPCRVRAVDMRNILLMLPFLLHNLLEEEVEEYNRRNPFEPITDPSDECIGIVLLFIDWYHLYRRRPDAIHQRTR